MTVSPVIDPQHPNPPTVAVAAAMEGNRSTVSLRLTTSSSFSFSRAAVATPNHVSVRLVV
jgi:hypothetical protein